MEIGIKKKFMLFKVTFNRNQLYLRMAEFSMIATIFIKSMGASAKVYLPLCIIAFFVMAFIDNKVIMPIELSYMWNKNPGFVELKKDVKYIKEKIDDEKRI